MVTQKKELVRRLSDRGWEIAETEIPKSTWWVDEILVLESGWSPVGFRVHLTFLVDPQHEGSRVKGEAVWAIGASVDYPANCKAAEEDGLFNFRRKWRERIPEILRILEDLRGRQT